MGQVEENLESQDLQYQLAQRARSLGWAEERMEIVPLPKPAEETNSTINILARRIGATQECDIERRAGAEASADCRGQRVLHQ